MNVQHVILLTQLMKNSGGTSNEELSKCVLRTCSTTSVLFGQQTHTTSHNRRLIALSLTSTNNSTKCFSEYKRTDSLKHFYFHIYVIKGNLRYGSRVTFCLPAAQRTEKAFSFKLALTGPTAPKEEKALAWSNAAQEKRTKHVVLSFILIPVLQKQKAQPEKRGQALQKRSFRKKQVAANMPATPTFPSPDNMQPTKCDAHQLQIFPNS